VLLDLFLHCGSSFGKLELRTADRSLEFKLKTLYLKLARIKLHLVVACLRASLLSKCQDFCSQALR
jgi:hypothetical protein